MIDTLSLQVVGLDALAARLHQEGLAQSLSVGRVETVLGRCGEAGSRKPLPSSAALVTVDGAVAWIPAPFRPGVPEQGEAPVYQVGEVDYVLPTIRLLERQNEPSYLALSEWILDAFTVWKFQTTGRGGERVTVLDRLKAGARDLSPEGVVVVIAEVIRLALLGSRPADDHWAASLALGLRLPSSRWGGFPSWLRHLSHRSELAEAVARRQLLTIALDKNGLPRESRKSVHRIQPSSYDDRGIDPVHTPEDKKIRFVGYLGMGVGIKDRRLVLPENCPVHLSASTTRIPFARFDAPRRLLIAAKMQTQAVQLHEGSVGAPLVRVNDSGPDPPGVNLRVGYLAWKGLNHEDAWVLSHSAALKLCTNSVEVQSVLVPALDLAPDILVHEGQSIHRGQPLLQRRVSPALLAPNMKGLVLRQMVLEKEESPTSKASGVLSKIEVWNLATGEGVPSEYLMPTGTASNYRMVVRFHIRQNLQLEIGDKLANRHGHKGIVGRILPDQEMPRWRGEPLDALIDPVSVLNRSSWGQVYETLLGGLLYQVNSSRPLRVGPESGRDEILAAAREFGCNDAGQSLIEPPSVGDLWMREPCFAVAGVQWLMRDPKHAANTISGDLPKGYTGHRVRHSRMRLSELGTWAAWAHGLGLRPSANWTLSDGAKRLRDTLAAAGITLSLDASRGVLQLRLDDLSTVPPDHEGRPQMSTSGKRKKIVNAVKDGWDGQLADLVFGRSMYDFDMKELGGLRRQVAYISVPPLEIRRSQEGYDGHAHDHELTKRLAEVTRRAIDWHKQKRPKSKAKPQQLDRDLRAAISKLVRSAYEQTLGSGHRGYKHACMGQHLLCPQLHETGRAVAAPAGWSKDGMELGLDEVGLPAPIASAVLGFTNLRDDKHLLEICKGIRPRVWIKRDPVLHRWGLLGAEVRVVEGNAIRLPASLLRPLAADFDGDAIMVFHRVTGHDDAQPPLPSEVALDEVLNRGVFYPGKQYVYGIHLLQRREEMVRRLDEDLQREGAPPLPREEVAKTALEKWAREAALRSDASGKWWSLVERYALEALAEDPGMGLGLWEEATWNNREVVSCGAAKAEVFTSFGQGSEAFHAYRGESLAVYALNSIAQPSPRGEDMIEVVMVVGAKMKGKFGNVPRQFLYAAEKLDSAFVRDVHALSEMANQQVLSVKAGEGGLKFAAFKKHILGPLARGEDLSLEDMPSAIRAFLKEGLMEACQRIRMRVHTDVPAWLRWLRRPSVLGKILQESDGLIELPLEDPRVSPFLASGLGPTHKQKGEP
jgi:hypothetical protein